MKKSLILIVGILLIGLVNATVYCDKATINRNWIQGTSPSQEIVTCLNDANTTVLITTTGSYFSVNPTILNFNVSQIITISFDSSAPYGNYTGSILFDGSNPINIILKVNSTVTPTPTPIQSPTGCQLNPSIISYSQSVQQNTEFELPKITFNPTNCEGELSINSAYITGGITTSEGQKPTYMKIASSKDITLGVNTKGLSSMPYLSKLTVTAFGKTFGDVSIINIIVTSGTNPSGTFDINNLPTCSLTANVLNFNSSYNMICTNLQSGIIIKPKIDTEYIIGLDKKTEQNQFIWTFKPIKSGNTTIKAEFEYIDVIVGKPFSQNVQISSTGQSMMGTNLKIIYSPTIKTAKNGETVILQLVDNNTNSLVASPEIYINGLLLQNSTGYSFFTNFLIDKTYNIRGVAPGYNNFVEDIKLVSLPITLNINPDKGDSETLINITTSPENISLFLDGNRISNPYNSFISAGTHEIMSDKEGYIKSTKNITIEQAPYITPIGEFKKGVEQTLIFNKNVTWTLNYQKDDESVPEVLSSETSDKIVFKQNKNGKYFVMENGKIRFQNEINGWDGKILKIMWYWWIGGAFGLIILFLAIRKKGGSSDFVGNVNA